MTEAPQPVSGSLEAKIIRKCPVHPRCHLGCPERQVENLGEIASFDTRLESPSSRSWIVEQFQRFFRRSGQ